MKQDGMIYNSGALRELEARYGTGPLHELASRALSELREREAVEDQDGYTRRVSVSRLLGVDETSVMQLFTKERFWLERIHIVAFAKGVCVERVQLGTVIELDTVCGQGWPLLPHSFEGVVYWGATFHVRRAIVPDTLVNVCCHNSGEWPTQVHILGVGPSV